MQSVFVAGSRSLSRLNAQVKERIDNIVRQDFTILIGDANGADKAIQRHLASVGYRNVIVYCMESCRNNVGDWPTRGHTAEPGARRDRFYYGIKDIAMARDATCGYMLWDGISKGTLANVVELIRCNKKVLLYVSAKKQFFSLSSFEKLEEALRSAGIRSRALIAGPRSSSLTQSLRFGPEVHPSHETSTR